MRKHNQFERVCFTGGDAILPVDTASSIEGWYAGGSLIQGALLVTAAVSSAPRFIVFLPDKKVPFSIIVTGT